MNEVYVYMVDMPTRVHEAVAQGDDGSYTIWINSRLDDTERLYAYHHALRHIERNDFQSGKDINEIEGDCHAQERRRTQEVG